MARVPPVVRGACGSAAQNSGRLDSTSLIPSGINGREGSTRTRFHWANPLSAMNRSTDSALSASTAATVTCSQFAQGPAMILTPCFFEMFGILLAPFYMTSLIRLFDVAQTCASCSANST